MSDQLPEDRSEKSTSTRTRNIMLGLILGAAALAMYASIFYRLTVNPLE